ncbi:integrase arm-type DNA-binding domain-containing protein [Novosphingobium sp. KA1]|uniref:tyrosine-type recombinase/integrase n=1 Tax=Novosphingobium sp. (strain KA1) TaxID=164608 RepID=UPI001A90ABB5|nr:integrase arm-type DNA-binding domain-containing protein [Novosphingobium sp. KA1]QSR16092.1 integrase [Novosphingobium sp. KA1]
MLTDQQCKNAKADGKDLKLADAQGLHLYVTKSGYKSWRLKYRFGGKERRIVFGAYPEISLKLARELKDDARRDLREGRDPGDEYKRRSARRTTAPDESTAFKVMALRWHELQKPLWKPVHFNDVLLSLEREVFPVIGHIPIGDIRAPQIRELLQAVQAKGAIESAHRLRQRISAIFRYAIAHDLAESDPASAISDALQPVVKGKQPALLKLKACKGFIRAFEQEPGHPQTKLASRLLALTAARPGTVHMAELDEFEDLDGESPIWRIPAQKMKLSRAKSEREEFEFIIPLSRQAVETVKVSAEFAGNRKFLFPSARHSHRPLTENTLNVAYRRLPLFAGRHVPHGWRSSFSTIMNERAVDLDRPADRAIIDLMLAHQREGVEATYNRAAYMVRRRELAQEWADLLMDGMQPAAVLIDIKRRVR